MKVETKTNIGAQQVNSESKISEGRKGFVKGMSFESGVKGRGSDR